MSMELGVTCKSCGLELGRTYPDKLPAKMANEMHKMAGIGANKKQKSLLDYLDKICLWVAIEDWNKRVKV